MGLGRYSRSFTIFHIPLFFSLFLILMSSMCNGHDILCKASEREALLDFKNGLSEYSRDYYYYYVYHPKKKLFSSWVPEKEEDCCKWEGISCDNRTGHVTNLILPGAAGNISHSLVNLTYLQYLDLNNGDFGRSSIPEFFGCFKRLRYLDLSGSGFQGDIPSQLGNLSALEVLNLSSNPNWQHNFLTSDGMWISCLSSLRYLDMSDVNLSKATSLFQELNKLPSISYVELSDCDLATISLSLSDANLTSLSFLDLSQNDLTEISRTFKWLFNLTSLEYLDLGNNYNAILYGRWISGLSSLRYLNMNQANLSLTTTLFQELNKLSFISHVELSSCHLDSISLSLSHANFTSLTFLDLSYNNLNESGRDKWLFNLTNLKHLDLSHNTDGVLDADGFVGHLCNLRSLSLSNNRLSTNIENFFQGCNHRLYLEDLYLQDNQITGQLPSWLGNYKSSLKYLDASYNLLSGPIPTTIGGLKSLQHLDLSSNEFNGHIPMSIGDLTSCEFLDLSNNKFDGNIPTSIGGLTSCQTLNLSCNNLSGHIPVSIGALTACKSVDLSYNHLNGHIPSSVGDLISCSILYISKNNLSGSIPSSISKLLSVNYLDLSGNSLEGIVSEENFLNLSQLYYLDFSENSLEIMLTSNWTPPFSLAHLGMASCKVGPQFPLWLQTQDQLRYLNMTSSNISDSLPNWIWNFSSYMTVMDISMNKLRGAVPVATNGSHFQQFINSRALRRTWSSLKVSSYSGGRRSPYRHSDASIIDLHANMLQGTLSSFPTIIEGSLKLSQNLISGPINLRDVSGITELDVSSNHLSGMVPSFLFDANYMSVLDLSDNYLTGQLPSYVGSSEYSCFIVSLHLNNNILRGTLPEWLKYCDDMLVLDVGGNMFTGNIPRWIARNMTNLQVLRLHSNLFYGKIPSDLSSLEHLKVLDLAKNYLSGDVPHNLGDFVAMKSRPAPINNGRISVTGKYVEVMIKGFIYRYYGLLDFLTSMDLSENKLFGEIPDELGKLCWLKSLNLSHNYFTGHIPRSFGNLTQLESLDLSRNNLSGGIPQSLTQMTALAIFNVSFNDLSGRIPTGEQFNTFGTSSYLGNEMLCGKPLEECENRQPPSPSINKHITEEGNGDYYLWLYTCVSLGFIMGFLTFWIILSLIKSIWRYAYFRFVDNKCKNFISLFQRKTRNA